MSISIIVRDLESRIAEIQEEKEPTSFFLKIADYGKYLLDNGVVEPFLKPLQEESTGDIKRYKISCEEFLVKWKELTSDLLERAKKEKVTDSTQNPFENQISELTKVLDEKVSYDDNYVARRFTSYVELLKRFVKKDGLGMFIPKHIVLDNDNEESYVLYFFYEKTQIEWEKFKEIREIKTWWAHYQIMRLTHGVLELKDTEGYFTNDRVIGSLYRYEFELIAKGQSDGLVFLKKERFREWIKRLHNYLVPRLQSTKEQPIVDDMDFDKTNESKLPTKRQMSKEVVRLKRVCKLGKKEAILLLILSNFEIKKTRELTSEIPTKDYKHLKGALAKKIKTEGWVIETKKGKGLNPDSFYVLARATPSDN